MITIFNRREVLITLDMKRQADVRNALASTGIAEKLTIRTANTVRKLCK